MILFVDACVRSQSRTRRLAEYLLGFLGQEETTRLFLPETELPAVSEEMLSLRAEAQKKHCFEHPCFDLAKQLIAADQVVIAAPFWDLSFPAILKGWLETVSVSGLTFLYGEDNLPHTLCKPKKLYYVTTAGGPIIEPEYGYGYVSAIMKSFFGATESVFFSAEHIDEAGQDAEEILRRAEKEIEKHFVPQNAFLREQKIICEGEDLK